MIPHSPNRLARAVDGTLVQRGDETIRSVTIDSRDVRPGSCFFAIRGPRDDGHRYLEDAARAGAVAAVVERPVDEPGRLSGLSVVRVEDTTLALQSLARSVRRRIDPRTVAVTGSVGKTTTKEVARDLLATRWPVHASPGNLNNQWGVPLSLLGLETDHEIMVAELGMSAPGEIRPLAELVEADVGVITNVAAVHMEFFEDLDGIAAAKEELAESLTPDAVLVVNGDDPRTAAIGDRHGPRLRRLVRFGAGSDADVRPLDPEPTSVGWRLSLSLPGEEPAALELPLPGEHSLENFLAAAAVAHALGMGAEEIATAARDLALPPRRGRVIRLAAGVTVVDDCYNASPRAMMSAVEHLARLPTDGRRILAAGDMLELGTWAEDAHREVGLHAAHAGVDLLITVGRLARDIGQGARAGGLHPEAIVEHVDAESAAAAVAEIVAPGDTVLVKGSRAMGMERIVERLESREIQPRRSAAEGG